MDEISDPVLAAVMLFFALIPLAIAVLGTSVLRGALRARMNGAWVIGTVVEVKEIHHAGQVGAHQISYQPIFEFAAPDGTPLRGEAGSYGHTNLYPVGAEREILVDFDKPEMVYMSSWFRLLLGVTMVVFGVFCAGFLLFAISSVLRG